MTGSRRNWFNPLSWSPASLHRLCWCSVFWRRQDNPTTDSLNPSVRKLKRIHLVPLTKPKTYGPVFSRSAAREKQYELHFLLKIDSDPVPLLGGLSRLSGLIRFLDDLLPRCISVPPIARFFEGLFRQHFLVCPFARRDRIFQIWPAACVDTDPTSCAQRLAFAGK
jgi:hypothetical protein